LYLERTLVILQINIKIVKIRLHKIFTQYRATERDDFQIAALMNWVECKKRKNMEY